MRLGRPGLRHQRLLPVCFVEILVAAPFATKDAALGHWVELGDVCGVPDPKSGSGRSLI